MRAALIPACRQLLKRMNRGHDEDSVCCRWRRATEAEGVVGIPEVLRTQLRSKSADRETALQIFLAGIALVTKIYGVAFVSSCPIMICSGRLGWSSFLDQGNSGVSRKVDRGGAKSDPRNISERGEGSGGYNPGIFDNCMLYTSFSIYL